MQLKDFLRLIRFPATFTAISNIIVAYAISSNEIKLIELIILCISSAFLYSAGMILNDYADKKNDKLHNPKRPLPSGSVNESTALLFGITFIATGIGFAFFASLKSGFVSIVLSFIILSYDFVLKKTFIGAAIGMGLCRAINILLGMSMGNNLMWLVVFWFLYIAVLTSIARFENLSIRIKKIVIVLLTIIPFIDAIILFIYNYNLLGSLVAGLLIPIFYFKKKFSMT